MTAPLLVANRAIQLLIPDFPSADELLPWLRRIDAARMYTNFGPLVGELERVLAQQWPMDSPCITEALSPIQVVTLSSGSASLEVGIAGLQLAQGGEVLLPALTFPATAAAVLRNGLRPVFADVAADTWQLSPAMARAAAAYRRLALVIPVATFGCPLDVIAWDNFVDDTGIPVLMDAAAAFGNQPIGRRAHVALSLHATKPFGVGEGGLFVTRSDEIALRVRQLSNFGFSGGVVAIASGNAKMSEYTAALALAQWARWDKMQSGRRSKWAAYRAGLEAIPGMSLQAGFAAGDLPANLVIRFSSAADDVSNRLAGLGIPTRRWYYPTLEHHPAFNACQVFTPEASEGMPVTRRLAEHALGLPWHNFLSGNQLDTILDALSRIETRP